MTQNLRNMQAGQKIWFLIKKKMCMGAKQLILKKEQLWEKGREGTGNKNWIKSFRDVRKVYA